MKNHLNDGQLRAALDGELGSDELKHLDSCSQCQARQELLRAQIRPTVERLRFLSSATQDPGLSTASAWKKFNTETLAQKETSMFKKIFASPLVRYGLSAALVIALIFAFPATRAMAGELLNLFRVQEVTVVPVDFTGLEQLTGDGLLGNQFTDLISDSLVMEQEPDEPVEASSAEQASQMAGFTVRVPAGQTPSQIHVTDSAAFTITLDRTKVQSLLEAAGRSDLVLPESVDGADISVEIPSSVSVAFGTCPTPGSAEIVTEESDAANRYPDCVILVQIPSPNVNAPASLDIDELARIGLEFTGMSPEEAAQFANTVNWTSTLVVPIPSNATTYEQVTVDGVTGTLIQRPSDVTAKYALLWVKDGIIHAISGRGADSAEAIEMANSLK
jgi:hypothetical protein